MSKTDPEHNWTIMVYLAGDNNLTDECVYSLKEMKRLDTKDRIKVTAQFDPRGRKTPVHRYIINKAKKSGDVTADQGNGPSPGKISDDVTPVVEGKIKYPYRSAASREQSASDAVVQPEANTGDPKTLFDFISWSVEKFPAENYMVVIAGHGGGTEEDFLLKDENPRASLSIPDLRRVFESVKKELKVDLGIIGMDVCLMSMGEVCFELGGLAKYVVSAEGYSATAGWPYGKILEKLDSALLAGNKVSAEELGGIIVNEYTNYYSEYMVGGFSSDMSLIDIGVEAMKPLSESVRVLTDQLRKELSKGAELKAEAKRSEFLDQIVLAHWEAQSYNGERFADLYDFCDLLEERYAMRELPADASEEERTDYTNLRNALERVKTDIKRMVKFSCYSGVEYQYSYGLSVYFPWAEVGPHYEKLRFARVSGWLDFLKSYTDATRRAPRGYVTDRHRLWKNVERYRTGGYRTGGYRTGGYRDPGQNPIYSMRNPPLTLTGAGQSRCLQNKVEMIEKLDFSFFNEPAKK